MGTTPTPPSIRLYDGLGNRLDLADVEAPTELGWESVEFTLANGRTIRVELTEAGRAVRLYLERGRIVFVPEVTNTALIVVDTLSGEGVLGL